MTERSLRAIKKEATAQALAGAAYDLALERGLDGFVIDDIVQRAGYSRRTFANHFSCKEEAVASVLFGGEDDAEALIRSLPRTTALIDVLEAVIRQQLSAEKIEQVYRMSLLCHKYPSFQPYVLEAVTEGREAGVAALMEFADGRYSEQYVSMLLGMAYGALALLFGHGSVGGLPPADSNNEGLQSMPFDEFLNTVFAYLRSGFQTPPA